MKNIFLLIATTLILFSCNKEKRTIIPELCGTWKLDSLTADNVSHSLGSGYQNVRRKLSETEIIYLELKENGDYKITRNNKVEEKGFIRWVTTAKMRTNKYKSDDLSSPNKTVYIYTYPNIAYLKKNIFKDGDFFKTQKVGFGIIDVIHDQNLYIDKGILLAPTTSNISYLSYYGYKIY